MDNRKTYYVVLDTETANGIMVNDKLDLTQSLVYDMGYAIIDKKGNIYKKRSFVNADIFCDYKEMMKSAYYAEKIPQYWEDIKSGKRILTTFFNIRKTFLNDLKEYNASIVMAHNASFDYRALQNTIKYLTKSKNRYFFPRNIEIWDTLKMSQDTICKQKSYIDFCLEHGYMTKHKTPRVRATAEIIYRYLTQNLDFIESHTGLEDVLIESQIFAHCMAQHKKMRKSLFNRA